MKALLVLLAVAAGLAAQTPADVKRAGLDPERLARLKARMQSYVDRKEVAGIVTLVARNGVVAHLDAVGMASLEANQPMRPDTIFQIMSMTKPFTGVSILMLAEDGLLSVADPVAKYLPEFRNQTFKDGTKPRRQIAIRDLMTHTSGLPTGPCPAQRDRMQSMSYTLAEAVSCEARESLNFEPGTKWEYSNAGIAALGRIVEVVSGKPFEEFVSDRILKPLDMKDTFFFPDEGRRSRIALVYKRQGTSLVTSGSNLLGGDQKEYRKGAKYSAPDFGLYSTAPDLFRWHQMLLNGGEFGGKRLLSSASVALMTLNHTGDITAGFLGGTGYGLSVEVVREPLGALRNQSLGAFGHAGAFGTQGWVDPAKKLVVIVMVAREGSFQDHRDVALMMAAAAIQ